MALGLSICPHMDMNKKILSLDKQSPNNLQGFLANQVKLYYLLYKAMHQISETGKGPEEQIPSMGCSIKWFKN